MATVLLPGMQGPILAGNKARSSDGNQGEK